MIKISLVVPNIRYGSCSLWSVLPSRGLLSLAGSLIREGFIVNYIDADIDNLSNSDVINRLANFGSNLVCITMNSFQAHSAVELARQIKIWNEKIKIIVGGPHASALGKKTLIDYPWIDIVCRRESEETIVELVTVIENNIKWTELSKVLGISYRLGDNVYDSPDRPYISNIDKIPFPAYELAGDLRRYPGAAPVLYQPSMHVMASRGCPYGCIFCTKSVWGRDVRFRSPENIVDEVELLHKDFGINEIFFQDDTMNVNREWFFKVCDEIIRRGLNRMAFKAPFRVNAKLLDEELLAKAKSAGFWMIFYGVESGNQKVLDTIKKGTTIEEIKRAFILTHNAGIKTIAAFMVGNIGDTTESILDSIALAKEIRPTVCGFSIATPLPGTEFYNIAKSKGWIHTEDYRNYNTFGAVSRNEALSAGEIAALAGRANREVGLG